MHFYRDSKDSLTEESLFLKDAKIIDVSEKFGEKYAIEVSNKFGIVLMAFNTIAWKESWKSSINKIVSSYNSNQESNIEEEQKCIEIKNKNSSVFYLELNVKRAGWKWLEMDMTKWIELNLNIITAKIQKRVVGFNFKLGIESGLWINHSEVQNLKYIATSQKPEGSEGNFIEVEVILAEKIENPSGDEINVIVRVGYLKINYHPPLIKSLITRVRKIRYLNEYDLDMLLLNYKEVTSNLEEKILKSIQVQENIGELEHPSASCSKYPWPYILIRVALSEVEGDFLHHLYATPFLKAKIGETIINYDMFFDHDELNGSLGGIHLYDLTNYPYTMNPKEFNDSKEIKMFEVLGLKDSNEKNTLTLDWKFYSEMCPLKKPKVKHTVKLYVGSIKYHYQQDLLLRVKDYFFDRFLDSITSTSPYIQEVKSDIEEKLIKFNTKKEVEEFDLKQEDAIIDLYCDINNPCLILRARNHYTEEFSIHLGNITVSSSMVILKDKWNLCPNKEVRYWNYKISINKTILYHRDGHIGNINKFTVDFQNMLFSEYLEYIDPLSLNRALLIYLDFDEIKAQITKPQFTYLMKCLDLNINYDDGMKDLYDFKLKKEYTELHRIKEDYKYMIIDIKMKWVSLSWYFLNEFLTEIVCQNMGILVDKFISYKNEIDISSSAIWVFGEESENNGFKQVIIGPMGCGNSINTDSSFYNFEIANNIDLKSIDFSKWKSLKWFIKMHNGDKEITVDLDNLKTFFKMHVFLLIFHFFTEGLPKYDIDDADLPNQCNFNQTN